MTRHFRGYRKPKPNPKPNPKPKPKPNPKPKPKRGGQTNIRLAYFCMPRHRQVFVCCGGGESNPLTTQPFSSKRTTAVTSMVFSPDGRTIVPGSGDNKVCVGVASKQLYIYVVANHILRLSAPCLMARVHPGWVFWHRVCTDCAPTEKQKRAGIWVGTVDRIPAYSYFHGLLPRRADHCPRVRG